MTLSFRRLLKLRPATPFSTIESISNIQTLTAFQRRSFAAASVTMAPNKTALDFVDFVNDSPTRMPPDTLPCTR
jgi:hypothetical protein